MKKFQKNQIVIYVIALMLVAAGYLNYMDRNVKEVSSLADNQRNTENIGEATLVNSNETIKNTNANANASASESTNTSTNANMNTNTNTNTNSNSSTNANTNLNNTTETNSESDIGDAIATSIESKESVENSNSSDNIKETANQNKNSQNNVSKKEETSDEYFINSKLERDKMYSQMLETYQNMLTNSNVSEEQKSIATQEIKKINDTKNSIMICENLILNKNFENAIIFVNSDSINVVVKSQELKAEEVAQIQNILTRELNCSIDQIHISQK
ncbi:MAG: SpoIIIAH-like family protein [Clostridia bacterium]|nr:SpoIIIAH-like family protein [Clostridia bacterium]